MPSHPQGSGHRSRRPVLPVLTILTFISAGCAPELDVRHGEAAGYTRESLGAEIYRIIKKDLARTAERPQVKTKALERHRTALVAGFDHTIPPAERSNVAELLQDIAPLARSHDRLPMLTRSLAASLRDLAHQPTLLREWARSARHGAVAQPATGTLGWLMGWDSNRALLERFIEFAIDHDGFDSTGAPSPDKSDRLHRALTLLARHMATVEPYDVDPVHQTLRYALDILLDEVSGAGPAGDHLESDPQPAPLVLRRDHRGLPMPRRLNDGSLVAPFVDLDGDDLADAAPDGHVNGSGELIELPPFGSGPGYDSLGRALAADGGPAYRFAPVRRTLLRAVLEGARDLGSTCAITGRGHACGLLDGDLLFQLVEAAPTLLGRRVTETDPTDGHTYQGFDRADSPVLDLAHAVLTVLDMPGAPDRVLLADLLSVLARLSSRDPAGAAAMLAAFNDAFEIADTPFYDDVSLAAGNTFLDDMLVILAELVATPGLLGDVVVALSITSGADLTQALIRLLHHRRARFTIPEADACAADSQGIEPLPTCQVFDEPVDRAAPDITANQSVMQRVVHLFADTSEVRFQASFDIMGVDLVDLQIPNLAEFYLDTVAAFERDKPPDARDPTARGCLNVDPPLVEVMRGALELESLEMCPTFRQVNRLMNSPAWALLPIAEARCGDGYNLREHHGDTLLAAEVSGLTDALRPVVRAFGKHGKTALLARILATVHRHYPTDRAHLLRADDTPADVEGSGISRWEALILDVLRHARFFHDLVRASLAFAQLDDQQPSNSVSATETVEAVARFLVTPRDGLRHRDGGDTSTRGDGSVVTPLSPFYLLKDAINRAERAVDSVEAGRKAWRIASDLLADHVIGTRRDADLEASFIRVEMPPLLARLLEVVESRTRALADEGKLSERLRHTYPRDLADLLREPELAAVLDLLAPMADDAVLRDLVRRALLHLTADENLDDLVAALATVLQDLYDAEGYIAAVRAYGRLVDPALAGHRLIFHALRTTRETLALDGDTDRFGTLLRNGLQLDPATGTYYIFSIGRVVKAIHRVNPLDTGPLTEADYKQILEAAADYLLDDERGVEQLYDIEDALVAQGGSDPAP